MLLDIHTHRNAAVPGECIFNVEPAWFEPVEGCYYSVGIHPWKVLEAGPEDWTTLEKAVCHPSVLAIGEAGLDRLGPADILLQKEVFVRQILLSESVGKPLVIHCVKAFNELIELKKKYRPQMPWVVHGFRNNLHIACRLMQENIYFSLGERYQPDVLRHVPLECFALIHGISILYPGVCVELSNGEKGLVITENEDNIFEPTVLDFRNNNLYDLSDPSVKQTIEIADVMKTMDNRIKLDKSLLEEYQAN